MCCLRPDAAADIRSISSHTSELALVHLRGDEGRASLVSTRLLLKRDDSALLTVLSSGLMHI